MKKKPNFNIFWGIFITFFINYLTYQYLKSVLISRAIDLLHIFFLLVTPALLLIFLFLLMIFGIYEFSAIYKFSAIYEFSAIYQFLPFLDLFLYLFYLVLISLLIQYVCICLQSSFVFVKVTCLF